MSIYTSYSLIVQKSSDKLYDIVGAISETKLGKTNDDIIKKVLDSGKYLSAEISQVTPNFQDNQATFNVK